MSTTPFMEHGTIKSIKADFVKKTITVSVEASLENFDDVDRSILSEWAEFDFPVDCKFSRHIMPAPLLDGVAR